MPSASLQTCVDTPKCVLEDRVQYSMVHILNVLYDGHLQLIDFNTRLSFLTTWLNLTVWQPTARARGDTRLALMPSVIPNSNYVIMVGDWNCLKYCIFACFCTVIIRCTETFWSPCITCLTNLTIGRGEECTKLQQIHRTTLFLTSHQFSWFTNKVQDSLNTSYTKFSLG